MNIVLKIKIELCGWLSNSIHTIEKSEKVENVGSAPSKQFIVNNVSLTCKNGVISVHIEAWDWAAEILTERGVGNRVVKQFFITDFLDKQIKILEFDLQVENESMADEVKRISKLG